MVATLQQLAAIDAAHQQQQSKNAAAVAALVLLYWRSVDSDNLAATGASFLSQSIVAILTARERSINSTQAYLQTVRKIQNPRAPILKVPRPAPPSEEQLRSSLAYTGLGGAAVRIARTGSSPQVAPTTGRPGTARPAPAAPVAPTEPDALERFLADRENDTRQESGRRQLVAKAMDTSGAAAVGAAVRHTQNGGRDYAKEFFGLDQYAIGAVRVARPGCCWFCALLASRGAVYGKDAFVRSDAKFEGMGTDKVHDSCGCAMRLIYTNDAEEIPDLAREADEVYRSVAEGNSKQRRLAFRQAWNARAVA